MDTEQRGLDALSKIEASLATRERFPSKDVLCTKYKEIREFLADALELVGKFPIVGKKIAAIIEFLVEIADRVCDVKAE